MITRFVTPILSRARGAIGLIGLIGVTGCTNVPELDATIPDHLRSADYPKLVRLDEVFSMAQNPREQAEEIEKSLEARRRLLQSKARRLRDLPE